MRFPSGLTSLRQRGIGFDGWRQLLLIWSLGKKVVDPGEKIAMSTIAKQILEKALVLSAAERAALVESLLASLEQPDARIDELWAKEAEDRLAAFEAGRMQAYQADQVFQEFEDL